MFLPNVNVKKKSAWDADPEDEPEEITTGDTKVRLSPSLPPLPFTRTPESAAVRAQALFGPCGASWSLAAPGGILMPALCVVIRC